MKNSLRLCGGILILLGSQAAGLPVLPPSAEVVGASDLVRFRTAGPQRQKAGVEVIDIEPPGIPGKGLRLTVTEACDSPLAAQATLPLARPVKKGAMLWACFFLRSTDSDQESGEGRLQLVLENALTFDKSLQFSASAAREWKEFAVPFPARENYSPGSANLIFRIGYRRQTLEIAGLEVRDFGPGMARENLPATRNDYRYAGMEDEAPWRAAAKERIEKIRKASLHVRVVDGAGRAVPGVQIAMEQQSHAYFFGSAVDARNLAGAEMDETYRRQIAGLFNIVTFQNDLKWAMWDRDSETPRAAARWCAEHGILLRGHTLVWPSWRKLPRSVKALQSDPAALRQRVFAHIKEEAGALGRDVYLWDVLNEPYDNHDLIDIFGRSEMVDWFRAAHEAAPDARLFINDYGIITGNGLDRAHQGHYEETIRFLLENKAPLDGIGIQGHFGQELTPPERVAEILDRFAAFGLPLQMTEFSLQVEDPAVAARYLRDMLTIFFSHPATSGFLLWGFRKDGAGYPHEAVLLDSQGRWTQPGEAWKDLIQRTWWTRETRASDEHGVAEMRGFLGRYRIVAKQGDRMVERLVELSSMGAQIEIALP
jgi:GH35 family endo-1,4-beta-xylanase